MNSEGMSCSSDNVDQRCCRLSVIFPAFIIYLANIILSLEKIKHLLIVYVSLTRCLKKN